MVIRKIASSLLIGVMLVTSLSFTSVKADTTIDNLNELISTGTEIIDSKSVSALTWTTKVDKFIKNETDCIFSDKIQEYCQDAQFYANVDSNNLRNKIIGHLMSYRDAINGNPITVQSVIEEGNSIKDTASISAYKWVANVNIINERYTNSSIYSNLKDTVSELQFRSKVDALNCSNKAMSYLNILEEEVPVSSVLYSLRVKNQPYVTTYVEGEKFNKAGLAIEATYLDRYKNGTIDYSTKEVNDFIVDTTTSLKSSDYSWKVTYTENGITKTTDVSITVSPTEVSRTLKSINIDKKPTKVLYNEGEYFEKAGMDVSASFNVSWSNGTITTVTEKNVPFFVDAKALSSTDKYVVVKYTYGGVTKTANVDVTVNPYIAKRELDKIYVIDYPTKISYVEGERFNPTGLRIGATYKEIWTNGAVEYSNIENINYTIDKVTKITPNTKYITVSFTENGITKIVNININVSKIVKPTVRKVSEFKAKSNGNKMRLTWKRMGKINGYQIQISKSKTFNSASNIYVSKSSVSYSKKMKKGQKYYFRIRAFRNYKNWDGKTNKVYGKWVKISKKIK